MISLSGVHKMFGALVALERLDLEIPAGQTFGFIGPNGAGKSTTMKVLAGLLVPDGGVAQVCGVDCVKEPDRIKMLLGYMPDFLGVYDDLTVDEYLQFFAAAYRIPARGGKRRAVIDGVLQLTDLTEKRHAMTEALSRGMQQRLGVARVLLHDPKVLLLDEPASGLDPRARIELRELIIELRRMGKTVMVSSHILTELAEMCTSIGIIERGKLLFSGLIEDAYTRAGIGGRIELTLESSAEENVEQLSARRQRLVDALLSNAERQVAHAGVEGDSVVIDLRPDENGRSPSHHFIFQAVVEQGGRIATFAPKAVRLEDAFLKLTKGAVQ